VGIKCDFVEGEKNGGIWKKFSPEGRK